MLTEHHIAAQIVVIPNLALVVVHRMPPVYCLEGADNELMAEVRAIKWRCSEGPEISTGETQIVSKHWNVHSSPNSSKMPPLKVLICGGGIAGNALAFWLAKLDHNVTVIERYPDLRSTGLQVDLRGHGIEVMQRMGLEHKFRNKSIKEKGIQFVNDAGKRQAFFPANRTGKGLQDFSTDWEIMRGDLVRLMYDEIKDKAKYEFGRTVQSFEQKGNLVEVQFSDAKVDSFDLLVGADGQGSRVRQVLLESGTKGTIATLGLWIAYFIIPWPGEEEEYVATSYTSPGQRSIMTRGSKAHGMQVYLMCKDDPKRGTSLDKLRQVPKGDIKLEKEALSDIFRGAKWRTDQILEALDHVDDFYLERPSVVKLDSWYNGRVALLGDAAYCPTANTGMGTSSSIIGAYILAGEIPRICNGGESKADVVSALREYDRRFRPFMEQVQSGVVEKDAEGAIYPSTAFGIAVMNFVLWVCALCRINVIGGFFLKEKVTDWSLPEYELLNAAVSQ